MVIIKPHTFRPTPENKRQLELARSVSLNVSELINEVLARHLKPHIQRRTRTLQRSFKSLRHANGKPRR